MTQSEYEAELHFRLCKSIFATLVRTPLLEITSTGGIEQSFR